MRKEREINTAKIVKTCHLAVLVKKLKKKNMKIVLRRLKKIKLK
jgi:hypothetical protein